jgi:hypothetical protein
MRPGVEINFIQQRFPDLPQDQHNDVVDVFLELANEGIIAPGRGAINSPGEAMAWPWFRITSFGRKVLSTTDYVPYDPENYLGKFRVEFPTADPIILRHLEEGLRCLAKGLLLAAPVMIGCAAEKAMLLLIETFRDAITDPTKKAAFEKDIKSWMISKKYDALWDRLQVAQAGLPPELKEDLHTVLDRVFDLIRTIRNDTGHPTGKVVDRETVLANFILFPVYCKRVFALVDFYRRNAPAF